MHARVTAATQHLLARAGTRTAIPAYRGLCDFHGSAGRAPIPAIGPRGSARRSWAPWRRTTWVGSSRRIAGNNGSSFSSAHQQSAEVTGAVAIVRASMAELKEPIVPDAIVSALQRLLAAGDEAGIPAELLLLEAETSGFLHHLRSACEQLRAGDVRSVLAAFARAQHMPPSLWHGDGGLAEQVTEVLEDLPDLQVVHVALLMAALELRQPATVLQEVVEHLDFRAPELSPTGLAAASMALSQLGPWPNPVGTQVMDELLQKVGQLNARELSAAALAAATLGFETSGFWQSFHFELLRQAPELAAGHVADVLLALATTRQFPISLLEALQDRLPNIIRQMEPDEALTCAWALATMSFFPTRTLPRLLEQVHPFDKKRTPTTLTAAQARQLRQLLLSLEVEPSASKAAQEVSPALRSHLTAACDDASSGAEEPGGDESVVEEFVAILMEQDVDFSLEEVVKDLYVVDVVVHKTPKVSPAGVGLVLDGLASEEAKAPSDPWVVLKMRHLTHLDMAVEWLPTRRWRSWDEGQRLDFVRYLLARA